MKLGQHHPTKASPRRRSRPVTLGALLAVAFAMAMLAGCGGSSNKSTAGGTSGGQPQGGTLSVGINGTSITTLDPEQDISAPDTLLVAQAIYDPLVVAEDGQARPFLAKSFTPSANGAVWTVKLRSGVKFQDGTPLDADAVVFNYKRFLKPDCACAGIVSTIKSVRAIDPTTVQFNLTQPVAGFATVLLKTGYLGSPTAIKKEGKAYARHPVGTGPYMLKDWVQGDHVTLERNPDYWGQRASFDTVVVRSLPDTTTRFAALRSGQVNLMITDDANSIASAKASSGLSVKVASFNGSLAMVAGFEQAPLNDIRVRQAIAHAIDGATLAKVVDKGVSEPSDSVFAKGSSYYVDPGYPAYDPDAAKKLVADYGKPIAFTYEVAQGGPQLRRAQLIQQMLKNVGIKMSIKAVDVATLAEDITAHSFQAVEDQTPDFINPDIQLAKRLSSESPSNGGAWRNAQADSLLNEASRTTDESKRQQIYGQFARLMSEQVPWIWLTHSFEGVIYDSKVASLPPFDEADIGVFRLGGVTQ